MEKPSIFQFRVELLRVEPIVWRRIQIASDCTFWDLHIAIQGAFAWNDSHLHEFTVKAAPGGRVQRFGVPMDEDDYAEPDDRPLPDWEHYVSDHLSIRNARASYCYDFGDDWQHAIVLEEILPASPGKKYPRCTAGERAAPPDDCGGVSGYESLLEILADPQHEEYKSSHRWATSMKGLRGRFDPEAFDEQRVKFENAGGRLRRMLAEIG
jgi:Plasmid pRiA4b ORF-3-like protein